MSLLKNLTKNENIKDEVEKDYIGGSKVLSSGLYTGLITLAYLTASASGATGLVLEVKTANDETIKQTLWMTSKAGKNYYEKDGKQHYLPGYLMAQSLITMLLNKSIDNVKLETKVVNIYNFESKDEVATKVEMITEILNKSITLGVIKQTVDKTAKGQDGQYKPTGEVREENEINKFFRAADGKTNSEILEEGSEATFIKTWESKWKDIVRDKTTKQVGGKNPSKPGTTASKPSESLFDKDE